ncbi:WSC domain-containing protein [Podospora australis]|uniref:WSC domain-containing protein n=1 Tax=Podospora australis TaxID=1536484 RepID=A0AAN6X1W9_9PEZI|nr:WSC domain-containing protein [Podospora australis]
MRVRSGQALWAFLLALLNLISIVDAQAYYGTVQRELAQCGSDNFMNLGCFKNFLTTAGTYFQFDPQGYLPFDPNRSFPGWSPGSNYNNTVTGLDCARVCRGFGYKFASMRDQNCRCGIQLPTGYVATADAVCNQACGGDNGQTCGGGDDAQIYLDPTFAANSQVPTTLSNSNIAQYYKYLGCFYNQGFPTSDSRASTTVADIDACFNLCAGLGYPLAQGSTSRYVTALLKHLGQVRCWCGTTFGNPTELICGENYSTNGNCDINAAGARCCGRGSVAPIYINTELQGCYAPRIPGYKASASDTVYECADPAPGLVGTPKTLVQPPIVTSQLINTKAALIRPPVVSVPNGRSYFLHGCYARNPPTTANGLPGIFNDALGFTILNLTPGTLDNCAAQCNARNYDAFGMVNGRSVFFSL